MFLLKTKLLGKECQDFSLSRRLPLSPPSSFFCSSTRNLYQFHFLARKHQLSLGPIFFLSSSQNPVSTFSTDPIRNFFTGIREKPKSDKSGTKFSENSQFFKKYSPKHNENEIRFAKNNNKITKNLNKVVAAAASVVVVVFKHSFSMLLQQERQRPSRPLTSTLLTLLQGKKPISAPTQRRRRRRRK